MKQGHHRNNSFRDYFPNSCKLDGAAKLSVFKKGESAIAQAKTDLGRKGMEKVTRTVKFLKSPGIEFVKKHLCIHCDHKNCAHKMEPVKAGADASGSEQKILPLFIAGMIFPGTISGGKDKSSLEYRSGDSGWKTTGKSHL